MVVVYFNRVDASIRFEMQSNIGDENNWIGIGLSINGAPSMGDDSVVACYVQTISNYWNIPGFYSLPLDVSLNKYVKLRVSCNH